MKFSNGPLEGLNDTINYNYMKKNNDNILSLIIDDNNLNIINKRLLIKLIINKIDLGLLNRSTIKPVIMTTAENDLYDITIILLKKLILSKEITIKNGCIDDINNENFDHLTINIHNKNEINYYPLILQYLNYKKIRNDALYYITKYILIIFFITIMSIIKINGLLNY